MAVMLQASNTPNYRMHADSKKRRSSFLVALLFAAGDASRYAAILLSHVSAENTGSTIVFCR